MEDFVEQALLYDFYGELLTEHQKCIYEDYIMNNLSVSEIADVQGISRQGVHDMVKRCRKILKGYENKLHLVGRFLSTKAKIGEINGILAEYDSVGYDQADGGAGSVRDLVERVKKITDEILEEL